MVREEELAAMKSKFESLEKVFTERLDRLNDPNVNIGSNTVDGNVRYFVSRYQEVTEIYNELVKDRDLDLITHIKPVDLPEGQIKIGTARSTYSNIVSEVKKANRVLETIKSKSADTSEIVRLTDLEKSINDSNSLDNSSSISKNLKEAIRVQEDGHPEASALVAGKTIDFILDELKSELNAEDWEDAIKKMEDDFNLENNTEGRISRAIKEYRNIYSHELDTVVETEDSYIVISGAIQLSKKIGSIEELNDIIE